MAFFDAEFALKTNDVIGFSNTQRTAVEMQVCISIAFESTWLAKNFRHPRYENFYGYAQLMSGAYVVQDIPLQFLNQQILYWEDEPFGINDTIICVSRVLAAAMEPSKIIGGEVRKTRQPYTSIRFKLLPGIIANIAYKWAIGESSCGNDIKEPNPKQGQPPTPNNSGASGGERPSNQGGDPLDPSGNDGDDSNASLPNPPSAGGGGTGGGTWKIPITGYRSDDSAYSTTIDTGVTDRNAIVTFTTVPIANVQSEGGKGAQSLIVYVNGTSIGSKGDGFALNVFNPYYN